MKYLLSAAFAVVFMFSGSAVFAATTGEYVESLMTACTATQCETVYGYSDSWLLVCSSMVLGDKTGRVIGESAQCTFVPKVSLSESIDQCPFAKKALFSMGGSEPGSFAVYYAAIEADGNCDYNGTVAQYYSVDRPSFPLWLKRLHWWFNESWK